jgi:hypothetical protein
LVKLGEHKRLKEIELAGKLDNLQIRADHYFGISVISLSSQDAFELRSEIDEWLKDQARIKTENALTE